MGLGHTKTSKAVKIGLESGPEITIVLEIVGKFWCKMVKAFIHDLKLDTTVPGNVWIAGNILGRLVGCYYIGGVGFFKQTI